MSDYIVGLTGGIGCGKTTVADEFAKLGIEIVDADVIARDIVKPGSFCLNAIVDEFGGQMLQANKTLDRARLRTLIFSQPDKKQWLNALMHPQIRKETLYQLGQAQSPYCLLVAPLLFENKLEKLTNRTLVIDVPESIQIDRTTGRDKVSQQQVESIIKAQIPRDARLAKADDAIDNTQPWQQVKQQIPLLHAKYLDLSKFPVVL
jgi:dephospho-CoA kinase